MNAQARADRPYLSRFQRDIIAAAAEVLLDTEAITDDQAARLDSIARTGRFFRSEAALVRLALECYADAHT